MTRVMLGLVVLLGFTVAAAAEADSQKEARIQAVADVAPDFCSAIELTWDAWVELVWYELASAFDDQEFKKQRYELRRRFEKTKDPRQTCDFLLMLYGAPDGGLHVRHLFQYR